MAKKSRSIIVFNEDDEKTVYNACDYVGVKDKHISTHVIEGSAVCINIFSGKNKFEKLMNKANLMKMTNCYW